MWSKIFKVYSFLIFILFLASLLGFVSKTQAGCGTGYTCAGVRPVDLANGCNEIPLADYCTQKWLYWQTINCYGPDCDYTVGGAPCTDTIKPCDYTYIPDYHQGFCCIVDPCEPEDSCSCGALHTSDQGFGDKVVSCEDGCGGTATSRCYCEECTPEDCPSNTFSSSQGNGYITTNCPEPNECGVDSTRTCYCPAADCADLDSQINWLNNCPSGETCREYTGSVPIPNNPAGCPATQDKTCHNVDNEKSILQTVEIVPAGEITGEQANLRDSWLKKLIQRIKAAEFSEERILNYYSTTHSGRGLDWQQGGGLNNPVGLRAVYSDTDGQDDILALYIWWNPSSTKNFNTPLQISTAQAQADYNNNWGFMLSRDSIGGDWNNVYVPRTYGGDQIWVRVGSLADTITIPGPTPASMVNLDNISVSNSGSNDIQLELTLEFLTGTDDTVRTSPYNLWAMANDYIGFTRYMEDGNIKDYDEWADSGEDWSLDMEIPEIQTFSSPSDSNPSEVTIDIDIKDTDDQVAHVRLDACKSGIDDPKSLSSNLLSGTYNLTSCTSFSSQSLDMTASDSLLGPTGNSVNDEDFDEVVRIDLGENAEGSITYYLTVLDRAGNVDQEFRLYKLEQWAVVKDGLVFGKEGVTSSTREIEDGRWDSHSFLSQFDETKVDLTNQVLLGARSLTSIYLRELIRFNDNKSFIAANYPGLFLDIPYQELKMAYKEKIQEYSYETVSVSGSISGDLSNYCSSQKCVLESVGPLEIENLVCDRKALIAVEDEVTITPEIVNDQAQDACIILAQGDININPVTAPATPDPFYDTIEAFLISGQQINILSNGTGSDSGLYVEGGLVSFTPSISGNRSSVYNQREIHYSNMGLYPVLLIDNNAKYGLFGREVFGSQIYIFKLEVGFKPY
jgi:hypothetical protein